MQWSLDRIIPQGILGDNYRLRLIKEYLKKIKNEKLIKIKKG
ncbi:hypothetical protein P872_03090 [Rhodonellum psychrophilum GCM71 = DSM 17998]|uniref:Uncharacterized protein n=2 Tax=Rhodonellum TaxID=336827 RepID=U5C1D4_9BACT|nr:hypothetical protein P872_03090 [Rhodonellum psychrophilum GCM71 = DSM 17998]SDY50043.1 hypothetical protein SAMN05444412_101343 [Rhodonellum ikkaensis]